MKALSLVVTYLTHGSHFTDIWFWSEGRCVLLGESGIRVRTLIYEFVKGMLHFLANSYTGDVVWCVLSKTINHSYMNLSWSAALIL